MFDRLIATESKKNEKCENERIREKNEEKRGSIQTFPELVLRS